MGDGRRWFGGAKSTGQLVDRPQLVDRADEVLASQDRFRALLTANAAVAAELKLPTLLRLVVGVARELFSAQFAVMVTTDGDGRSPKFVHSGLNEEMVERIGRLRDVSGIVALLGLPPAPLWGGRALLVPAGFAPESPLPGSFLAVPIHVGDAHFGTLCLRPAAGGVFCLDDQQLITALAATAGVAIDNARRFSQSEQRRRWSVASAELMSRLLSPGSSVGGVDDSDPLEWVVRQSMDAADADFATLVVPEGSNQIRVAAATGDTNADVLGRTSPLGKSPVARVIRSGTPVLVSDDRGEVNSPVTMASAKTSGSVVIVPITAGERTVGALTLGRAADRDRFTDFDLDMAVSFGIHAAVALALWEGTQTQLSDARTADHDRIAIDLHDQVIGELFAVGMGLQGLAGRLPNPIQAARVNVYVDSLDRVISTIRNTIFQLRTRRPDPEGLQARIVQISEAHTEQLGFVPQLRFIGPVDLSVDAFLAADILAVTREALSNCARHAEASRVMVSLALADERCTLEIVDNGKGIGQPTRSSGLINMRRRAEKHAGHMSLAETESGGTQLIWSAPCVWKS